MSAKRISDVLLPSLLSTRGGLQYAVGLIADYNEAMCCQFEKC